LNLRHLPPALQAVGIHALTTAFLFVLAALFARQGHVPSGMAFLILEGILAGGLSRWLGQPVWWQLINLAFFPAAGVMFLAGIAPIWYLAAFLLLAASSLGAVISRVPLYLSSAKAMRAVAERIPQRQNLRMVDLGCGTGGLLRYLAESRPDVQLEGVDAAPLPWLISRLRLGRRAGVRFGSLWDEDLSRYDVVYAYLSPAPMHRLWEKARREMHPGSLFISNTFAIPDVEPDEVVDLQDLSRARLLLWRM
jgi:SAM-dependent methyltransferase